MKKLTKQQRRIIYKKLAVDIQKGTHYYQVGYFICHHLTYIYEIPFKSLPELDLIKPENWEEGQPFWNSKDHLEACSTQDYLQSAINIRVTALLLCVEICN